MQHNKNQTIMSGSVACDLSPTVAALVRNVMLQASPPPSNLPKHEP